MKNFMLSLCCLVFGGCATAFVEDIGKDELIDFDTDKIIAIGTFKDKNEFVIIGEKYIYQPKNSLSSIISEIPNEKKKYTVLTNNVDIVMGLNGSANFRGCFIVKINEYNHYECAGSASESDMKIYKNTLEVKNKYPIKTDINVHLKYKNTNKMKKAVSKTLRPFATALDLTIFPVYLIGNDWN